MPFNVIRALPYAEDLALQAARLLMKIKNEIREGRPTEDQVRDMHMPVEWLILTNLFPIDMLLGAWNIPVYAEEYLGEGAVSGPQWIINTIDGKYDILTGESRYGISLALAIDDVPMLGVIALPARELIVSAIAGQPATAKTFLGNPVPAMVSNRDKLMHSTIWTDWPHSGSRAGTIQILSRFAISSQFTSLAESCAYGCMKVALGENEAYVVPYPGPRLKECAAAGLILQCAGAMVTDREGLPWTLRSTSLVASNGKIHEILMAALH